MGRLLSSQRFELKSARDGNIFFRAHKLTVFDVESCRLQLRGMTEYPRFNNVQLRREQISPTASLLISTELRGTTAITCVYYPPIMSGMASNIMTERTICRRASWTYDSWSTRPLGHLLTIQTAMIIYGPKNANYDIDLGPVFINDWYHK